MEFSPFKVKLPKFYYGWIIVGVVAMSGFVQSQETFPVIAILLKPITEEFGWSRATFAGAMAIGTVLGGFLGPAVGPIVDRYGPRVVAVPSLFFLGLILISMGGISALWQFYGIQITARLIVLGILGLSMGVLIPKWFVSKRGRAVAFTSMGNRLGTVVLPLLTQTLVNIRGWRTATMGQGLLVWIIAVVPALIFLRRQPEDLGLLPDGAGTTDGSLDQSGNNQPRKDSEVSLSVKQVIRLPSFYLLTLAGMLNFFAAAGLNLHLFPYLTDSGIDPTIAATVITTWAIFGAIGSVAAGFLAEKITSRRVSLTAILLMALAVVTLPAIQTTKWALGFSVIHGLGTGGWLTLELMIPDYFGRRNIGAIRGITAPIRNIAIASGPVTAGLIYDVTGSYTIGFLAFFLGLLGAFICVLFAQPPKEQTRFISESANADRV